MLWFKLSLIAAIVMAVTGGVYQVTSFVKGKDHEIALRDQTINELNAKVTGLRTDFDRVQSSYATLEQDLRRKIEEAAKARHEATALRASDAKSILRQQDLERKLNDPARVDRVDRLTHSRVAERVMTTVNRSAKCEIENFFQTDGQCRNGQWVSNSTKATAVVDAARAPAEGASNASR